MIVGTLAEQQGVRVAIAEMAAVCAIGVIAGLVYLSRVRGQLTPEGEPARAPSQPSPTREAAVARERDHLEMDRRLKPTSPVVRSRSDPVRGHPGVA